MTYTRTSPYRVEVNPWVSDDELHQVFLLRGVIISALAYCETRLTELAIRASKHPAYVGAREKFPSGRDKRMSFLGKIVTLPGPLLPLRMRLTALLREFQATFELRDIMAHGGMQVLSGDDPRINTWDYVAGTPAIDQRTRTWSTSSLDRLARRAARLSRATNGVYNRACRNLPELVQG